MPLKFNSDGTWSQEYKGPFTGLNTQAPETEIPENSSPSFSNFMLRNSELRSRPNFALFSQGPTANNPQILGIASFRDANGIYHTVLWNVFGKMYQYNSAHSPPWDALGTTTFPAGPNPISYRAFASEIWFTNVAQYPAAMSTNPFLAYWDGIAAGPVYTQTFSDASTSNSVAGISKTDSPTVAGGLPGAPTVVGPLAIGAQYLGELNNQLILANVSVLDQNNGGVGTVYNFPNLIWWSANGLPLQWDPTQNTSAGFNAFLDVPDQITGLATLGVAGYIFRANGITQMAPTGSAVSPWEFDHMWASDHGIGNVYPWSIAQYGPSAVFISADNIYSLSVTDANPIGGTARDSIFADLTNRTLSQSPFAGIVPILVNGYSYLTYQLAIPLASVIRFYVYAFEEKNWAVWDVPNTFTSGPMANIPLELYCQMNQV